MMLGIKKLAGDTDCELRKPLQPTTPSMSMGGIAKTGRFQLKRIKALYGTRQKRRNA